MLDEKDKLIIEYLMNDCRITTTKLARLTRLSQPSIIYRIKKLEEDGFISKYDALLDFNKLPVPMYMLYLSVSNDLRLEFEKWCIENDAVMTLGRHANRFNYSITALLLDDELRIFEDYFVLKEIEYEVRLVKKSLYLPYSIFNLLHPTPFKIDDCKGYELDLVDLKILEFMIDGGARESVKNIAIQTELSVDLVTYRLKKLKKYGYFKLFIAQPDFKKFDINLSFVNLKVRNLTMDQVVSRLHSVNKTSIVGQFDDENYFATTIITNIQDYKQTLDKFYEIFDRDLIELTDMMLLESIVLNRLNLQRFAK